MVQYNELLTKLTFLTKRNNLSNSEIGKAINLERRAISGRAERNSNFKPDEVDKIQQAFGVRLTDVCIADNSFERQNDAGVHSRVLAFGRRLAILQDTHEFLDKEMAKILKIDEDDYLDLKCGDVLPDVEVILRLKQCFKVSVDWLLFGG